MTTPITLPITCRCFNGCICICEICVNCPCDCIDGCICNEREEYVCEDCEECNNIKEEDFN